MSFSEQSSWVCSWRQLFWRCSLNQGWFHFDHFTLHSLKLCSHRRVMWCAVWRVITAGWCCFWTVCSDEMMTRCMHWIGGDFAFDGVFLASVILTERAKHGHCSTVLTLRSKGSKIHFLIEYKKYSCLKYRDLIKCSHIALEQTWNEANCRVKY